MGIFSSIKEAIFGKAEAKEAAPSPKTTPTSTTPRPVSVVNVEAQLDGMQGSDALNWRTSIVDLMKLVGLDPSYANRKELAQEMGRDDYSGTAEDNIWLHKQVLKELAANGGTVPSNLLD